MRKIEISMTNSFLPEILLGRQACLSAGEDFFDARSYHCVASEGKLCIGSIRITRGTPSVFATWTNGQFPSCITDSQAELTRGFVVPSSRGLGLYRVLMLAILISLERDEITTALGAVEPAFHHLGFLQQIGFELQGKPIVFLDTPRETVGQPITCSLQLGAHSHIQQLEKTLADLRCDRRVEFEFASDLFMKHK